MIYKICRLSILTAVIVASNPILNMCHALAWEFSRNPDRFPSVGIHIASSKLDGHRDEIDTPNLNLVRVNGGDIDADIKMIGVDFRLPVNNSVTVTLCADSVVNKSVFNRVGNVYRESEKTTGMQYGFNARLYFNK